MSNEGEIIAILPDDLNKQVEPLMTAKEVVDRKKGFRMIRQHLLDKRVIEKNDPTVYSLNYFPEKNQVRLKPKK